MGLRDRALIGVMVYTFARVSAVVNMTVSDYRQQGKRSEAQLHEKGGVFHKVPMHHMAQEYLDAYVDAVGIADERKTPLFRSAQGKTNRTHRAYDVLLFSLAHPRWEFVFQPIKAPYLNLIEPWWKTHHSLAFAGGRFESWAEMEIASRRATDYWNQHKHPFVWGTRKRHRSRRRLGLATTPVQTQLTG